MNLVYLDNNATTKPSPEVIEEMLPFLTEKWGNPSSMYTFGGNLSRHIENARKNVANFLGAKSREIIFTSGGTESDNTAIKSALKASPEKNHIVVTNIEHPAVLELANEFEKDGFEVTYTKCDKNGVVKACEIENSIQPNTALVSVMWANNEVGTIMPIKTISDICKKKNALFHTDAVQAAGKIKIDLSTLNIDFLSISGHKIHAPKGIGALYVKESTPFSPMFIGGHQERGKRAGTENTASIIALGKACELASKIVENDTNRIAELRNYLEAGIIEKIPNVVLNAKHENRLSNTTSISFRGIEGEAILLMMNEHNICASTGSACSSGSLEPSHVLLAMGISHEIAHGTVRFSLSQYSTKDEIDYVLDKLPPIIEQLRNLSPIYKK